MAWNPTGFDLKIIIPGAPTDPLRGLEEYANAAIRKHHLSRNPMKYTTKIYSGDYIERQEAANKDGAICYIEQHFNSKEYDDPSTGNDNPILTVVAHNASQKSMSFAECYSSLVHQVFDGRYPLFKGIKPGVLQRVLRERGDYNLRFTKMPAILVEPLWVSDLDTVKKFTLTQTATVKLLAKCIVDTVVEQFPEGGLVALSIGHIGKTSQPFDKGAPVFGRKDIMEGDLAKLVIQEAEFQFGLVGKDEPALPSVQINGREVTLLDVIETLRAMNRNTGSLPTGTDRLFVKPLIMSDNISIRKVLGEWQK